MGLVDVLVLVAVENRDTVSRGLDRSLERFEFALALSALGLVTECTDESAIVDDGQGEFGREL